MLILGIETSGPKGSIALCRKDVCLAEAELDRAPRRHAQTLVLQIGDLFAQAHLRLADLEGVAVSIGPGSFTGLRVGVVCAKLLAYATPCPLAAVDTLEAIAANSPEGVNAVSVIADAQRGDLFVGTYHRTAEGEWLPQGPPAIQNAASWLLARKAGDVVTGPGLSVYPREPAANWQSLPEAAWIPSARTVAQIGTRRIERGLIADCAALEPFYLRRSAAEEKADPAGASNGP